MAMQNFSTAVVGSFFAGIGVGIFLGYIWFIYPQQSELQQAHSDTHSPHSNTADAVHVHADFIVHVAGETLRFTDATHQTTSQHRPHADLHLHDGSDHIVHRHADDATFTELIHSLGLSLTDTCITVNGKTYCSDTENTLLLFVNGEIRSDITSYVFANIDQILLYYGNPDDSETIASLYANMTDEACIYSGTCPERGTAPPESCGLTCEL